MNIAVIPAAGIGTRMGDVGVDVPKQFLRVFKKPILIYTLEVFEKCKDVDAVVVVCHKDWMDFLNKEIEKAELKKVKSVIPGGATGQESRDLGINEASKMITADDDIIIIMDSVRALVSEELISRSILSAKEYGAAAPAVENSSILYKLDEDWKPYEHVGKDKIFLSQTPQAIQYKKLMEAHALAKKRGITDTSATCQLLFDLGEKIQFVRGDPMNIKITAKEDLTFFKEVIRGRMAKEWLNKMDEEEYLQQLDHSLL